MRRLRSLLVMALLAVTGAVAASEPAADRLAALGKRLERLQDANEVEIVQRTYGYFVDKAMWTEVSDLFAEDGTYEIGGRGIFVGRKRVLEYLQVGLGTERPVEGRLINHMQFQPIVTVSEDGKTAKLRMKALVMSSGGWGDVIYENSYVKEDGIWKIASVRAPFVMYSGADGWAKVTTPNTRPESFPPPPDRMPTEVYLTYPSQYIVPFHYPNPVTGRPYQSSTQPGAVDTKRMLDATKDGTQWMSYGRTWDEQRFSPLKQINDGNVSRLGLQWFADLNTHRGVEANPLFVDGVLYDVVSFNVTTAFDARTGQKLWTYDPKVPPEWARYACCGPSVRGLAVWKGKVYLATLDGRLIALDAKTGSELWSVQTFDKSQPFSITGPVHVFDGKIVIGNAGGDYGVRAFVAAYDPETGRKLWKFYLVPGDPAKGPDGEASDSIMPMATKTWSGEWWKYGGGGSAWDSIVFDPKLRLVYVGTGNGAPIAYKFRSPGGGDNLFLCSIVALDADTGAYRWHYQMIPQEQWDYDCVQTMILADVRMKGRTRQVLMQAPKNGFFYVLDRATGELLSAEKFVPNTWASHIDMKTGRPVVFPDAYLTEEPKLITPSAGGAHNWNPMAFSPLTGLAYIPVHEQWYVFAQASSFKFVPFRSNSALSFGNDPKKRKELLDEADRRDNGYLLAWDVARQKEAFRIPYGKQGSGGVLVTAGNLIAQGTINKTLAVYRAEDGRKLWEMPVDNVPISSPITYMLDGEQYIAVNAGWGGGLAHVDMMLGKKPMQVAPARLLVFKLDAKNVALPPPPPPSPLDEPPPLRASEADIKAGGELFNQTCSTCHGVDARGGLKDLRFMSRQTHAQFNDIVLGGIRKEKGMASFADLLTPQQVEQIHGYLISRGHEDWNKE